jgi:GDP-L-fucose synthase
MLAFSTDARVYVAGHHGMVGSAIWRALKARGFENLFGWRSAEVDLTSRDAAMDAIRSAQPDVVIDAAARVGGILANSTYPVEFLADNVRIQTNVFEASHLAGVERLLFLGSSCIYPRLAPQPISESSLLTGPLEETNIAYAIAKIAGIVAVRSYRSEYDRRWISAMPTNLYGPGDNFDLQTAHVLPALLRRFHEARISDVRSVALWGSGAPRREFLHVDDLASACLHLLEHYDDPAHINIGVGSDYSIAEAAAMVAGVVGYEGAIEWDRSKPDGTPRKLLDVSRMQSLGWQPEIDLSVGLESTYAWFLEHVQI